MMMMMMKPQYDVIVIGSGLAGLTAANILGRSGHSVLLLEQHYKLGGLATTFNRLGGHIFDISLHGFPVGMIKSCKRYWNVAIANRIVQLPHIRFDNPQFSLETTFTREDFSRLLIEKFRIEPEKVDAFFDKARTMSHYDDQQKTTRELFEEFFPGRSDIVRLLMEPITYANGSTLEDPALTYGIVFSNFMSKGVYTFEGGTDLLIRLMRDELLKNGVDIALDTPAEKILLQGGKVTGCRLGGKRAGQEIGSKVILSNANLKGTIFDLVGKEAFDHEFVEEANAVRLNNSSTQVYMAFQPGEVPDETKCGDLLFSSTAPSFQTDLLLSRDITSRTYSFYYPKTRPGRDRSYVVASTNANYADWKNLSAEEYQTAKQLLIESTLDHLDQYVPNVRNRLAHIEAATPCTFERYTGHWGGASFGTKYEGLAISRELPKNIPGLFHTGSVGIIMSGWLGAVNYGVITANDVEAFLL